MKLWLELPLLVEINFLQPQFIYMTAAVNILSGLAPLENSDLSHFPGNIYEYNGKLGAECQSTLEFVIDTTNSKFVNLSTYIQEGKNFFITFHYSLKRIDDPAYGIILDICFDNSAMNAGYAEGQVPTSSPITPLSRPSLFGAAFANSAMFPLQSRVHTTPSSISSSSRGQKRQASPTQTQEARKGKKRAKDNSNASTIQEGESSVIGEGSTSAPEEGIILVSNLYSTHNLKESEEVPIISFTRPRRSNHLQEKAKEANQQLGQDSNSDTSFTDLSEYLLSD